MLLWGLFIGVAIIGGIALIGQRRGWRRNGYLTLPATVFVLIAIFVTFQIIGNGLTLLAAGFDFKKHNIAVLAMNAAAQVFVLLAGTFYLSRIFREDPLITFRLGGVGTTPRAAYGLIVPAIMLAQFIGVAISSLWASFLELFPTLYQKLSSFENASDSAMKDLVVAHNPFELVLIVLFIAIVPAICEETLFRGFVQSNIEHSGCNYTRPKFAIIITSLLFAAFHGSIFKFPGLAMLGLTLGWFALRTDNILVSAVGHATNNGIIAIMLYLLAPVILDKTSALTGDKNMSLSEAGLTLLISVPLYAFVIWSFNKITNPIIPVPTAQYWRKNRRIPEGFTAQKCLELGIIDNIEEFEDWAPEHGNPDDRRKRDSSHTPID